MNIAIIGYGIVGGGVHALLADGGLGIHVRRVLDVRRIDGLEDLLTDNIADILGDPDIDVVVEAIGGMHPALSYVTSALRAGKHVVTSNKELISNALAPLREGAAIHGAQLRFTASVGGGIPWLYNLQRQKRADTILALDGIVNGTTNYILHAMQEGVAFEDALQNAQRLGYAEIDASADLRGLDSQRKCAISAALAFDAVVEPSHIPTLGIEHITGEDIAAFAEHGRACRLMMYAASTTIGISAYVEPTALGLDTLAAHTPTNHNLISLHAEQAGHLAFFGQGAGRLPTAENVVQDLLDIQAQAGYTAHAVQPLPIDNVAAIHPYYIRTDSPGLVDGVREETWGAGILTRPLEVATLHRLAKGILAKDPKAFFAGVQ